MTSIQVSLLPSARAPTQCLGDYSKRCFTGEILYNQLNYQPTETYGNLTSGMGTGKVALQLFLQRSRHVFGIELAPSRWRLAIEALASLAAARPRRFCYEVALGVKVFLFTFFSLSKIQWVENQAANGRSDSFLFCIRGIMFRFLRFSGWLMCTLQQYGIHIFLGLPLFCPFALVIQIRKPIQESKIVFERV